jgi:hypothetical protein
MYADKQRQDKIDDSEETSDDEYRHNNYQRGAHDVSPAWPCDFLRLRLNVLQKSGHPRNIFTHGTLLTNESMQTYAA